MPNISLTLYTNSFFGSILMSPIQMGSLSVNNLVTNISRLGTFDVWGNKIKCKKLVQKIIRIDDRIQYFN